MISLDLIIIGAGPVGLAAAIEAKRNNLSYVVLEKGILVNSINNFPTFMRFFTEAHLLEIGGYPFPSSDLKPTRQQALDYYRRVVQTEDLDIKFHHEVKKVEKEDYFVISGIATRRSETSEFILKSQYLVIATGYFDNPIGLSGIPGERGANVSYYYSEPHKFFKKDVVIIGAGNSGAEISLELFRHGANVTVVHKYPAPKSTLKYWVGPDFLNRIKDGDIKTYMPAITTKIDNKGVYVVYNKKEEFLPADQVFIVTGFLPNLELLAMADVEIDPETKACELSDAFQSNIDKLYVLGSTGFGKFTNRVFIENGRNHAQIAVKEIKSRMA